MKPVILWTDALLFTILIVLVLFFFKMLTNPEIKNKWKQVFFSRTGVICCVILFTYVLIATLDSIHYRKPLPKIKDSHETFYSNQVYSLLDDLLGNIKTNTESTYSKPFARYSAVRKVTYDDVENKPIRYYPPLIYGGKHLKQDDSLLQDVIIQTFLSIINGLIISTVICGSHYLYFRRRKISHTEKSNIPWTSFYVTSTIIICFFVWVIHVGNLYHILGTNQVGKDTLYESIKGIRTGVLIGTLSTLIMLPFAIILGISAGYFKGWVDDIVHYLVTILSSIPFILLAAAMALLFQAFIENNPAFFEVGLEKADGKFLALCFILGITGWSGLCRMLRAETLKISQLDYIKAAYAYGLSHTRIIFRHILPNLNHIIMILLILDFSSLILAEAVLSFVGIGVDPAMASWGNMVNLARTELARTPAIWWNLLGSFFFMFVLVMSANLLANTVTHLFSSKTNYSLLMEHNE